jgi:hypothetical protein
MERTAYLTAAGAEYLDQYQAQSHYQGPAERSNFSPCYPYPVPIS